MSASTNHWKHGVLLIIAGLLITSYVVRARLSATDHSVPKEIFGNQENFAVFRDAQHVTAQLLHRKPDDPARNWSKLSSYFDADPPVALSAAQADKIRQSVTNANAYEWATEKHCIPDYGVMLNFVFPTNTVRVALCFTCNMLAVFSGTNDIPVNLEDDFDFVREELVSVMKSVFPNDSTIQALK